MTVSHAEQVERNLAFVIDVADDLDQDRLDGLQLSATPCPVCGAFEVCGYDDEGRALIHREDDE